MSLDTNNFWTIYKLFHDPPGTPKETKCVACKVAISGLFLGLAGLGLLGVKKTAPTSAFQMISFLGASVSFTVISGMTFRLALENNEYNQKLMAERAKEISAKRREYSQQQKQSA